MGYELIEIERIVGSGLFCEWERLCTCIESFYDMEKAFSDGGKRWLYEYKYRRGGKTLCALYAAQSRMGLMIIFGKQEREKLESLRDKLSPCTCREYDEAQTYHDGKWAMFSEKLPSEDLILMLSVKRRPNRKDCDGNLENSH